MIDYGPIEFACPPGVGEAWFVAAAQLAGLGPSPVGRAHQPFPAGRSNDKIRVSLVRNPYSWFGEVYARPPESDHAGALGGLPRGLPLWDFLDAYLERCQGELSRLAMSYEADTVLRIEDCPAAAVELLSAVGVRGDLLAGPFFRRPPCPSWGTSDSLRKGSGLSAGRFRRAEHWLFDRYDYW